MSFLRFPSKTIPFHPPQMITHLTELVLDVNLARSQTENLAFLCCNQLDAITGTLPKHRRTIPHVKNQDAPGFHMPSSGAESGEHVTVFQLVAENSKHHQ